MGPPRPSERRGGPGFLERLTPSPLEADRIFRLLRTVARASAPVCAPRHARSAERRRPRALLSRGQLPRTLSYTMQNRDPERRQLSIDFVIHSDKGVAGPWAAAARPGDTIQLRGNPGGAYAPDPQADWHLTAGDASVLPAISASLARVPAGIPVHVLVEIDDPEEEGELQSPGELHLTWVYGDAADHEPEGALGLIAGCRYETTLALSGVLAPAGASCDS